MTSRPHAIRGALMLGAMLATGTGCDTTVDRIADTLLEPEPTATAAPVAPTRRRAVTLTATSAVALQGFTLRVEYPTAKGGFAGSADGVECTSAAPAFTPNDKDDGTMILVSGTAGTVTFPIEIRCSWQEAPAQTLRPSDLAVVVQSVTGGGLPGNPRDLSVTTSLD